MQDFYNIDSLLSEEEIAVRDSVRRFVDDNVLPIIGECYVEGRFPREIVPGLAVPIGIGPSRGDRQVFFYLSFEHPF